MLRDALADFQWRFSLGPGFERCIGALRRVRGNGRTACERKQAKADYGCSGHFHKSMVELRICLTTARYSVQTKFWVRIFTGASRLTIF
jgi:hypothetical protein